MGKKKKNYRLLTVKAYFDADADILAWWESIESGDRSTAMREAIRLYTGQMLRPKRLDIPELVEVRQDTRWIVDALNDMPAYLERVIHQVASLQPAITHQARAPDEVIRQSEESLDDEQVSRRAKRMKKATW